MARRTSNKIQPAVMTLNFEIGDKPVSYVDLSQCASIVNRRFYRQGLNWAVAGFRFGYAGTGVNLRVSTLPNTWVLSGAWEKAMRHWQKQQREALEQSDSLETKGRFNDFKIYADTGHRDSGSSNNLLPTSPGGFVTNTDYLTGEWLYSQIVIPNDGAPGVTNEYTLTAIGPSGAVSKGLIDGYANSRNTPQSPDPVGPPVRDSWLQEMFDVGDNNEEVTNNAQFRNDQLPYDQVLYPDQFGNAGAALPLHREISFTGTTIGAHQGMAGVNAPCGLIQIAHNSPQPAEANSLTMQIMLVPGNHRGYLAESMVEM